MLYPFNIHSIDLTKGIDDQKTKLDCVQEHKSEKDNSGYQHREDLEKDSEKDSNILKTVDCDVLTENSANGELDLILVHRIEAV